MFTLVLNDFLRHILTLPRVHRHSTLLCCDATDRSVRWEVSALPDGTLVILIKEGKEVFDIQLCFGFVSIYTVIPVNTHCSRKPSDLCD